ncbi:MAG: helix-turn-helix domain-containing protein [Hyphomicrobiaceae bacterium]
MPVRGTGSRATALQRLRTAMIEKKLTQAELADAADCHEKTVQNLLQGRSVRDQTLFDVCMVLGIDYDRLKRDWAGDGTVEVAEDAPAPARRDSAPRTDFAPLDLGGYTRPAVEHYAGSYVTIRPAFRDGGIVHAYRTDIAWDDDASCLAFRERDRPDAAYAHSGRLYIPASSMFLHLVSLTKGAMRMVLLAQMDPLGRMRGLVTTLTRTRGAMFMPVAAPIVYLKSDTIDPADLGELNTGHPRHEEFRALLVETLDQSYARLQQP